MSAPIDIKLIDNGEGEYDIGFSDTGDFILDDSFETAILMSIFCEKRADKTEVPDVLFQRGWIGNLFFPDGYEIGSKIWLYEQARLTNDTINGIKDELINATKWMIEDGYATDINVTMGFDRVKGIINTTLKIQFSSGRVKDFFYELWIATGA